MLHDCTPFLSLCGRPLKGTGWRNKPAGFSFSCLPNQLCSFLQQLFTYHSFFVVSIIIETHCRQDKKKFLSCILFVIMSDSKRNKREKLKKLLGHIACDPAVVNCDCLRHCFTKVPFMWRKLVQGKKVTRERKLPRTSHFFPHFLFTGTTFFHINRA